MADAVPDWKQPEARTGHEVNALEIISELLGVDPGTGDFKTLRVESCFQCSYD